jgi:hypothetical protein
MKGLPRVRAIADALMPLVVFLLFVTTVALIVLVQSNDDNIDKLGDSVASVETSTERVENFVDDLEAESASEVERNAAITRAVQLVPEIKDILCEEFPTAAACAG